MPAMMIVMTKVIKTEGWEPYQSQVADCFAAYGGQYVAKRQTPELLEGRFDKERITLFEFPSMEAIRALWHSDQYQQIRKLRDGLGELDVVAIPIESSIKR